MEIVLLNSCKNLTPIIYIYREDELETNFRLYIFHSNGKMNL